MTICLACSPVLSVEDSVADYFDSNGVLVESKFKAVVASKLKLFQAQRGQLLSRGQKKSR